MILGRSFLATVHTRVKVYQGELSLGTEDDRVVFDICGNVKHRTNPSEEVFMVNGAQADVLDCIERLQAPKVDHKRKGEALSPESAKIRKHICKPVWDYGNKDIKVWPTCDPNLRKCNGGDTIYGIGKDGTLMEWECFVDDKRGSIEGLVKGELFKEDKQKSSDSNERLRNSPAHYERFNGKFENDVEVIADEYALKMGKRSNFLTQFGMATRGFIVNPINHGYTLWSESLFKGRGCFGISRRKSTVVFDIPIYHKQCSGKFSVLILLISIHLNSYCTIRTLYKTSGEMGAELPLG
ncbi:hypothetical protein Tco_1421581 [Tanacetum coccineum]